MRGKKDDFIYPTKFGEYAGWTLYLENDPRNSQIAFAISPNGDDRIDGLGPAYGVNSLPDMAHYLSKMIDALASDNWPIIFSEDDTTELCPECGFETPIPCTGGKCANCGHFCAPCSLCVDYRHCHRCRYNGYVSSQNARPRR